MGWRSQPTASVHLDKVFVPAQAMLGQQGAGFKIAMHALDGGRINIAACRCVCLPVYCVCVALWTPGGGDLA